MGPIYSIQDGGQNHDVFFCAPPPPPRGWEGYREGQDVGYKNIGFFSLLGKVILARKMEQVNGFA